MLVYLLLIDSEEDRILFGDLYEEYRDQMMWKAKEMLSNHHDAEDAVHNAFVGIASSMDAFHTVENVPSYMLMCVENAAKKILEKRYGIFINDELEIAECPVEELLEENRVVQCINELSKNDREILKLHDLYGLNLHQCAKKLNITESAARQRHARAVKRLAEKCKEEALL